MLPTVRSPICSSVCSAHFLCAALFGEGGPAAPPLELRFRASGVHERDATLAVSSAPFELGGGETKVLHHLMPEKSFEHWSWSIQWGAGWLSAEDAAAAAGDA